MLEKTGAPAQTVLRRSYKRKPPPLGEFAKVEQGVYWAHDLGALRTELFDQGWPIRVSLSTPHIYRSLSVHISKDSWCQIVVQPSTNEQFESYCERLSELSGVTHLYHGENLPSLTFRLFLGFL